MTNLSDKLQDPNIVAAVLKHLENPLKPNMKAYEQISDIVEFPLHDPLKKGGLTEEAIKTLENMGKQKQFQTFHNTKVALLLAGAEHKTKTHLTITSILKVCELYIRYQQKGELTEEEKRDLKNGIAFRLPSEKSSFIPATIKNNQFSKHMQKSIDALNKAFLTENKNSRWAKVLNFVSKIHIQNAKVPPHLNPS